MTSKNWTRIAGAFLVGVVVLSGASPALANHNDDNYDGDGTLERYSSSLSRKIRALDDDPVKTFAIPVLLAVDLSDLTENFGDPRDGGARTHEGLDIMAPLGTPIVSPTEAVVTRTGSGESAGKYVYTANPGGETFRYMHLDEIGPIKAGDTLKVGDLIGTVGDTGNAKGGPAHLHLETREGAPSDPFPRLKKVFSFTDQIKYVDSFFNDIDDADEMAEFLVGRYTADFTRALNQGLDLPTEIEKELKKRGIVSTAALSAQLAEIIASIPKVVTTQLVAGDSGTAVSLMQFFLVHADKGPSARALGAAGATGYFGPVTAAAIAEYQTSAGIPATGVYDAATRAAMLK